MSTDVKEENIMIEPIINKIGDQQFRYFKIKNSEFTDVVFTITEIQFVPTRELPNAPEDVGENEKTATGRVLFEETGSFTSKELLNNEVFGTIVRDVFDKMMEEFNDVGDLQSVPDSEENDGKVELTELTEEGQKDE